jgi:hypothetical protein
MKLFAYGFWSGFHEKTNPGHIGFFQDLFEKVFKCKIEISYDINDADILLETIFEFKSMINYKNWRYSFLFTGESTVRYPFTEYRNFDLYTCVLGGFRNNNNIVNVPLYIVYLHCNNLEEKIQNPKIRTTIPPKNICAIISNPDGDFRNLFLEKLDSLIKIDFAGDYKNNVPKIMAQYDTDEFREAISEYKFIIAMENSQEDTYITEKITHGFLTNIIPVYWGSPRIHDYFNSERFINLESADDIDNAINKIGELINNPEKYLQIVNQLNYKDNINQRTIDEIVKDIRNLILPKPFSLINQIYFINNPEFEPEHNYRLIKDFTNGLNIPIENLKFTSPTYKTTITDEIYNTHVKKDLMLQYNNKSLKKSELSLILNYKAVLEDIEKNYKDGLFLIFESDVLILKNALELNSFLEFINSKKDNWDLIHIGYDEWCEFRNTLFESPYCKSSKPYRNYELPVTNFIEDITNITSQNRLIRKFHTRCCDSFIWSYKGIIKFLKYLNTDTNYGAAFDYYLTNFLEKNQDFKHYWTTETYFIQGSNHGVISSTIQND